MPEMPKTGECWLHYKGGRYVIIGLSRNPAGCLEVVYSTYDFDPRDPIEAPLFNQPLERFLQDAEPNKEPRFDRDPGVLVNSRNPWLPPEYRHG